MSLFSCDLLVNYIRYLQCLNLVNYLHEYSIYTAPGFLDGRTSILVIYHYRINVKHTGFTQMVMSAQ